MEDLIKEVFKAGEEYGRACEANDYLLKDSEDPNTVLKRWLKDRLDKCLPCDNNVRVELVELYKSL